TLRVAAANADKVWSTQIRTLTVVVPPFWWESIWFFIALVIVAAAAVVGGLRFRVHRVRVNQSRLTELVGERTSELSERTNELAQLNARLIEQMSERERAEAGLRKSHQGMATLISASEQLASRTDVDLLPDRILDQLALVVGYSAAAVGTLEGDVV